VDFKLAFQEYRESFPDPETVPRFTLPISFWPSAEEGEGLDFYQSSCLVQWCHRYGCLSDLYYDYQKKQRDNVQSKVKALLEEYENEKPHSEESLEKFLKYMEQHHLIQLLPGVVPGFALRHRKWGKWIVMTSR
jgi:hypothetical protein